MNELTREQVTAITNVIRTDATCQFDLFDGKGHTCVLGGLYAAKHNLDLATIDREEARMLRVTLSYEQLGAEWGLNLDQVDALYLTNDCNANLTKRRDRLTTLVESWAAPL